MSDDKRVFMLVREQEINEDTVMMYRARFGEGDVFDDNGECYTDDVSKARRYYGIDEVEAHREPEDSLMEVATRRTR